MSGKTRLNAEDVHEIRSLRETTGMTDGDLGAVFGVTSDAIGRALGKESHISESNRQVSQCPTANNQSRS